MAPHAGSATAEQIHALFDYLEEHPDLARGKLRSVEGKVQAKRLWEELCEMLNAMGGCTKTIKQWQKVWFDRKHLAKKAAADSRRLASATGGGPLLVSPLSEWELKVLKIMGDGFGQARANVPALSETTDGTSSTSSEESLPPSLPQPPALAQNDRKPSIARTPRPSLPRRRGRTVDLTSRMLQYEDKRAELDRARNNELSEIKYALLELCDLVKEFLYKKK